MIALRNLALALLLAIVGCKKNDPSDTIIHGRVVDYDSRKSVSRMQVECYFVDGDAGIGLNLGSYSIGTATTDGNGNYSFAFTANPQNSPKDFYRISGYGRDDHYGFETQVYSNTTDRTNKTLDFDCVERIPIQLDIIHTGPVAPADYMFVKELRTFPNNAVYSDVIYADSPMHTIVVYVARNHPSTIDYIGRRNGLLIQEVRDTVVFRTAGDHYAISY